MEIISLKRNESGTFSTREFAAYEITYRAKEGDEIATLTVSENTSHGKAIKDATIKLNRNQMTRDELLKIVITAVEENSAAIVGIVLDELSEDTSSEAISSRIRLVNNSYLEISGNRITGALAEHLMALIRQRRKDPKLVKNDDWRSLVSFTELLFDNVNPEIRDQLYNWMQYQIRNGRLTLTPEGKFIGYKGLNSNFGSIHAGPGIVNGVSENGHLDNSPGNVIEVDRDYVDPDRTSYCSTGLHVGSYDYAQGFGQIVVTVEVDPRDVVSVPDDYNGQKLRSCKYRVIEQVDSELASFSVDFSDPVSEEVAADETPFVEPVSASNKYTKETFAGVESIPEVVYNSDGEDKTYTDFRVSSVKDNSITGVHSDGWATFKFNKIVSTSLDEKNVLNAAEIFADAVKTSSTIKSVVINAITSEGINKITVNDVTVKSVDSESALLKYEDGWVRVGYENVLSIDDNGNEQQSFAVNDQYAKVVYKGTDYYNVKVQKVNSDRILVTCSVGFRSFLIDSIESTEK